MAKLIYNGDTLNSVSSNAGYVAYDDASGKLDAGTVQAAIAEIADEYVAKSQVITATGTGSSLPIAASVVDGVSGSVQTITSELSRTTSTANSAMAKANANETALSGKVNTSDVIDNLTTESSTQVLSANQGKILLDAVNAKYSKPSGGIPKSDLAADVASTLGNADTAVQTIQIGGVAQTKTSGTVNLPAYPTTLPASDVSSWAKASTKPAYTAAEVGALPEDTHIPSTLAEMTDDTTHRVVTDAQITEWSGKSTFNGDYNSLSNKPTLGTAAAKDVPASGNAAATQVVLGSDSRLSDARPASDVSDWAKADTKPSYTASEVGALPTGTTLANLTGDSTHRLVTDAQITSWSGKSTFSGSYSDLTNKPTLGTAAAKDIAASGNASTTQVVMGNDTRLSDARPASDVSDWAKAATKPTYTASEVGALASTVTHLSGDIATSEKGANNGVATLGSDGKIPSSQLPSYVDDVLEYAGTSKFPTTGESGKIYVDTSTNKTYRWSGTTYVEISPSIVVGTTTGTALDGKVGTDHINSTSNPHGVTKSQVGLGNVENKSSATIRGELTKENVTTALGYTPPTTNTTYESKATASGGTDVSLVTTGEKYTWNNKGTYSKPSGGIPKTDLASAVQTSLGKADTALQSHQDISGKADKATTLAGYGITDAVSTNANQGLTATQKSNARANIGAGTSSFSGSYNDLTNKPTIPSGAAASKGVDTTIAAGSTSANLPTSAAVATFVEGKGYKTTDNDTKNTAGSTDTSSKIFLVGATSQAANPQTYSHDTAYVGTDGCLYSGGTKVLTSHQDISGKQDKLTAGSNITISGSTISATNTTYGVATTSANGLMSAADKKLLDNTSNFIFASCSTAAATQVKEITIDNSNLTSIKHGDVIGIYFSNTNTYDSTTSSYVTFSINNVSYRPCINAGKGVLTGTYSWAYGSAGQWTFYRVDTSDNTLVFLNHSWDTTYSPQSLGIGYGTCTTPADTSAKVVTLANYNLTSGSIIAVRFTYAVSGGASLNVNNKGAVKVFLNGSRVPDGKIKAGDVALFAYNGTQYELIASSSYGTQDNNTTAASSLTCTSAVYGSGDATTSVQTALTNLATATQNVTAGWRMTGTIAAGSTSVTLSAPSGKSITDDSAIDIYFKDALMAPTAVTVSGNTVTVEIEASTAPIDVMVKVEG